MTSHRGQFPAKKLSVDLDRVDVRETGFWWCARCHRVTELLDSDCGLSGRRCTHCHSQKIEWKPALTGGGPVPTPDPLPEFLPEPSEEGKPKQKKHRLPPEKRDLRVLARTGYWFCYGCAQVTERDDQECCVLCTSSKVEWNDPIFSEALTKTI